MRYRWYHRLGSDPISSPCPSPHPVAMRRQSVSNGNIRHTMGMFRRMDLNIWTTTLRLISMNIYAFPHCVLSSCFLPSNVRKPNGTTSDQTTNTQLSAVHVIDFFSRRARSRHHIRFTSISRSIRCAICFLRSFHVFGVFHAMHSSARFPLLAFSAEYKFLIHVCFFFLVRPQQRLSSAVLLALFSFHIFVFVSFILTSVHDHMVSVI